MMIINFRERSEKQAALYELPFEYVKHNVLPKRAKTAGTNEPKDWWLHHRTRPAFWKKVDEQPRYIATPRHSKHRFFIWLRSEVVPDSALVVVARSDDYMFGVMSSCIHETWARSQGTQVRDVESGFRYTPESCFDTFPFPWPPGAEPSEADYPIVRAIADAARELVRLRDAWLNPPGASEYELKDRTLTKLYNAPFEWLDNAHRTLDEAVFAAYGWPSDLTDQEILARLLALNHERATKQS